MSKLVCPQQADQSTGRRNGHTAVYKSKPSVKLTEADCFLKDEWSPILKETEGTYAGKEDPIGRHRPS